MWYQNLTGGAKQAFDAMVAALERAAIGAGLSLDSMVMRPIQAQDLGFTNNAWILNLSGGVDNSYNEYFSQAMEANTFMGIHGVSVNEYSVTVANTKESTVLMLYDGSTPVALLPLDQLNNQTDGRGYMNTYIIVSEKVTAKGELYTPTAASAVTECVQILGMVLEPRKKNINP